MPGAILSAVAGAGVSAALMGTLGPIGAPIAGALVSGGFSMLWSSAHTKKQTPPAQAYNSMQKRPDAPHLLVYGRSRVGGVMTYAQGTNNNRNLHLVLTYTGHEIDSFETFYFNEESVPRDGSGNATGKYAGYAYFELNYGTTSQVAFPTLVALSGGSWTSNHRQRGCAGAYVQLGWNADLFPTGLPNVSCLIKGKKVYDPRDLSTAWSNNPALCLADYLTSEFGLGLSYDDFDATSLAAAANACEESVTLDAGGTESRYTCNGVVNTEDPPDQVIEGFLSAMAGMLIYSGGKFYLYAGVYQTPVMSLDEDSLRGPITVSTRRSRMDATNRVRGKYIESTSYQPTDFPPVISATYTAEDNDEQLWLDIELPFTTSATMAQRIAKISLERARRQIEISLQCKLSAMQMVPGDTFYLSNDRFGWSSKVFEATGVRIVVDAGEVGVDITAREIDSNVFEWTSAEEGELAAEPTTNLPDPFTVQAPGVPSFSEDLYETTGSAGVKTRLTVSWPEADDGWVEGGGLYQLEYSSDNSTWVVITNIRSLSYEIQDAQPGLWYFRVKAINIAGVSSEYSSASYTVIGLNAIPTDIRSFSVRPSNGYAHLTWALHDDLDVRIGGVIEVRHTPTGSLGGVSWPNTVLIDRFDGGQVVGVGPLVQGYYAAKARDSSGNYSSSFAAFYADEALITGYTTVNSVVEAATFPGSKVNLEITGGTTLQLTEPSSLVGTYYFPNSNFYVDCGSSRVRRFESDITMTRYDDSDLVDLRGSVDAWSSIDGGAVDRGDALLYVQTTKTHPGSSASVWTDWTPFRVADFEARAARFKLEFVVEQATHNIGITALNVHIKVPS